MTSAESAFPSAPGPAAGEAVGATFPGAPRGRLFRKYALLFIALIAAALLINSAFDFWFSYQENKAALFHIQREKAQAAAARIEEFVEEIERQIGWTTHAQWAAGPLDQRLQDFSRLLRQVPPITELSELDGEGREQLKVSRLSINVIGSGQDFSQSPAFIGAKASRIWFSPVYFRKQSEPYMTLAIARDGRNAGVTVAEINLKLIWDVITALRIGQGGYAYVVDGRGRLIAHPDISLVLRDTDLSNLPQVAAALRLPTAAALPSPAALPAPTGGGALAWGLGGMSSDSAVTVAKSLAGRSVLTAHATIAPLGWHVFVEVPLREAFAPLYGAAMRTAGLLVFGLIAATLAALVLARRMTGPIRELQEGAARIGAGDLGRRIDIRTGDELEALAGQFNHMAGELQQSYAELEQRVRDRTAELSEALEQQTATAEVLGVINSSPGDLAPVFDAILEKARTRTDAVHGDLWTYDGECFHLVATHGEPGFAEWLRQQGPLRTWPGSPFERVLHGEAYVHLEEGPDASFQLVPEFLEKVKIAGIRTTLMVALRKEDALLGAIVVYRCEMQAFSDKQIALVQNFAAQAVIAMENARLITETREALEQQTATAEVLGVINASPGDLAPVFDSILDKAHGLCGAELGVLMTFDGERFWPVAAHGASARFSEEMRGGFRPAPGNPFARIVEGAPLVHIDDIVETAAQQPDEPGMRIAVEIGLRTFLIVPLRKDGVLLGAITANRREVRPFSDKQIALLQNFAAQAVIAMENARLITETREALERQTATAEVLQVINSSPGDLAPVFEAMLERGLRLSAASFGVLCTFEGGRFRPAAMRSVPPAYAEFLSRNPLDFSPDSGPAKVLAGQRYHTTADFAADELTLSGDPHRRALVELGGARTGLAVPLRKDAALVGMFLVFRPEVRPFSEKQIALLENFAAQAVIAMENARLITETREALAQQTATAEVLQVINSSPGDLTPVFDAMLEKALQLCDAAFGRLDTYDGKFLHTVATRGVPPAYIDFLRRAVRPAPGNTAYRLVQGEEIVRINDMRADEENKKGDPARLAVIELGGARSMLQVGLYKDAALIGRFVIYRTEVKPFSDKQVALLQNFAAQAVIAMENARLITETREALEQQTATAEVLGVINASPGDLAPVFDAILEKAHSLCGAAFGTLTIRDGGRFHAAALHDVPAPFAEIVRRGYEPGPNSPIGRLLRGELLIHIPDLAELAPQIPDDPVPRAGVELGGVRTLLMVPLRKDDTLLGVITAFRQEVRPFTDRQVALLQNFAAQAVIAMENARLITETREALEQQTATAEVLGVINSSPGDLAPVFDAMLDRAMHLCGAAFGMMLVNEVEQIRTVGARGVPAAFDEFRRHNPIPPGQGGIAARIRSGEPFVHIVDLKDDDLYRTGDPQRCALVDLAGARTSLVMGLKKDREVLGAIHIYRNEVRPFTDKQIALLQNFAAQAVIAMENARLITETREALEQQTATAEVLGVINASPGDLAPVFDAILEKAHTLCGAAHGALVTLDGEHFRAVAMHGLDGSFADLLRQPFLPAADTSQRLLHGERLVHIPDMTAADMISPRSRAAIEAGFRTLLFVPLRKDEALLGYITALRREARAFTDREIDLLRNFAAQAVIAMENARLITETREALEQQTATAEVLGVINSSPGDLAPVFDTVVATAARLCNADMAGLMAREGEVFRVRAEYGVSPQWSAVTRARTWKPGRDTTTERALLERQVVHVSDIAADAEHPHHPEAVTVGKIRTLVSVPLLREGEPLGVITLGRQRVEPFTDKQIQLVRTFADQAVIAMENARLITETREALEQQTATAEVLGVINASPGDLAPVFDAILEKAHDLCGAAHGSLMTYDGEFFRAAALHDMAEPLASWLREPFRAAPGDVRERLLHGERFIHIPDIAVPDAAQPENQAALDAGVRTLLIVPLRKDDALLGYITANRREVRPFTDKQIALLENFAAQAVIAMENARLLTETRERTRDLQESLEYQTATSDVLQVISQSTFDLQPVLETVAETAARLCDTEIVTILRRQGDVYRVVAARGWSPEYRAFLEDHAFAADDQGTLTGRVARERRAIQVADVTADPSYTLTESVALGKARTQLGVPLLREGSPIGVIVLSRQRVEPFTDKQIALVTTFADQAVIAIENARLLNELRERTDELARSVEELKALSEVGQAVSSTLDLRGVLSTILDRSVALAGVDAGAIFRYRHRDRTFRFVEAVGYSEAMVRDVRRLDVGENVTGLGIAIANRTPLQIPDLRERPPNPLRDQAVAAGFRSVLIVPLVGADRVLGATVLQRRAVGEFPEATVRLMQTLAAQSALAIQNARLFNEIAEKSEQLAEASRHKSQFLANMSHELRTPLNAILGYTELMADGIYGELAPRAAGVLERVQNNGKHLLALINDVLDLSKIEAGQLVLTLEDYAMADVVQSVVSATESLANNKGLKFTAEVQPGLPTGRGDARRLSQVLLNLVGNAVKFTDAGEVAIGAAAEDGHFVLTVRDTGPGIAPEDQSKIFEEFQQIDNSNTRKKGGTGLGLAISKRMVEMQGGTISVDSEVGKGATFCVTLPVRVEELTEEAAKELMGAA